MNNLKYIREVYGITQEEIARAINVNRTTISNWEQQEKKRASSSSLEKLSLFYGIGPEYFYDKAVTEIERNMLIDNAKRQRRIERETNGKQSKANDFSEMFSSLTFNEAIEHYMTSTKLLLATAEDAPFDKLETALIINKKLGARLQSIVDIRKQEAENNELSLSDLLYSLISQN